jgi:hypothetical protein
VHVCIFAFDLLFRDGASLLHLPLEQRRRQLAAALPNMRPGRCALAHSLRFPGSGAVAPAAGPAAADDQEQAAGPGPSQQGALAVGGRGVSSEQAEGGGPEQQEAARAAEAEEQAASAGPAAEEEEGEATEERLQQALLEAFAAGTGGCAARLAAAASRRWLYCAALCDSLAEPLSAHRPRSAYGCRGADAQVSGHSLRAQQAVRSLGENQEVRALTSSGWRSCVATPLHTSAIIVATVACLGACRHSFGPQSPYAVCAYANTSEPQP